MLNEKFQKFGKKSNTIIRERFPNAVIYTRVSTSEQENNFSLETQLEKCEKCAKNNELSIIKKFGGVSESAKTDDRKEFNEMLKFVKNIKNKIGYIIVSDIDRFSRTGMRAVALVDELKTNFGIKVLESSATSITDNVNDEVLTDLKITPKPQNPVKMGNKK